MLNNSCFSFGLLIQQVYDNGRVYSPEVLDITEAALHARFLEGVRNIASVCLEIGYPTLASIPHTIINTVLHTLIECHIEVGGLPYTAAQETLIVDMVRDNNLIRLREIRDKVIADNVNFESIDDVSLATIDRVLRCQKIYTGL
ncbi:hypothetical protein DPEC_G00144560 [Dallia pectoralis]|uniref:Uncharacterized protein n=1 Tax=Dallia pectoralis TaxID=75939 RepID=A0ACC2GNP6_DALPE|nr:hypothetical protein DPEC_G00144560 [Dallia pectoralis]